MKSEAPSTQTIWDLLNSGAAPDDIESVFEKEKTFSDYMNEHISKHPELTAAKIARKADIPKSYANEILTGKKKGSRDRIIALCYAAGMSLEETRHGLIFSGNDPLYPKRKRDAYIIYIFNNIEKFPTITDINLFLSDKGEEPLLTSRSSI